ncbi:ogr/Delta-like zinc finger family protein [Sphingopyxis yananensis]|uniref:ogr/Delta-like zinc finger family protein n=1 Tax=Sphingopyxis yananensis TaxID=2886687 RepID=UPI001D108E88|nr:ogr/Delta-like zinc finger family protein [Sphingopyxis yananensis]
MNMHTGTIMSQPSNPAVPFSAAVTRPYGKAPAVNCPACGAKALTRSSEEITPTFRRLYLACTQLRCAMTFTASLAFEHVLSPSGVSAEFRPARIKESKAPGHDFGQMSMLDLLPPSIEN